MELGLIYCEIMSIFEDNILVEGSAIEFFVDSEGFEDGGGYIGEGAKTVLPSVAHAKISMRLVPNQDSATITKLFTDHFLAIAPDYVKVEVIPHHGGDGFLIPISSPAYKAAEKAMTEVYGIEPVPSRGGGSIPILADLQRILEIDPLLMGFGLERDTIHSPNESYLLKQLFAGMEAIALFYRYY